MDPIERQAAIDTLDKHLRMTDVPVSYPGITSALTEWLNELPSAQPEITMCKDCKWWGYDDDDGVVRVCHAAKHGYRSPNWDIMIYRKHKGDFYCSDAERRDDG